MSKNTNDDHDASSPETELDVFASPEEGEQYGSSAYVPVAYDNLDTAPKTDEYPDTGTGGRYRILDMPRVPKLSHIVGPSAIMLGASLGSGETLFWPLLIAENGWNLYWAFWIGILAQFVLNTEIQRWTLATGESIFRSFGRVNRFWPWFFLFAGFVSLGWPGWAASAARVGAAGLGLSDHPVMDWRAFGILLMVLIWVTYQLTPLMYNIVERFQLVLVSLSTVSAIALFVVVGSVDQLANVPAGAASIGTLPPGSEVAVFLGGLAYAGAGGYLNLSQSLWVREKGYGMGRYQGRIKNPLIGDDPEHVQRDGFAFRPTEENIERWKRWWAVARLEHFLTFVVGLFVVATIMMSIAAEYAAGTKANAVAMWLVDIVPSLGTTGGVLVYFVLFLSLFTTEYAIVESFVRNSADIVYESYGRAAGWSLPQIFWGLLTIFTAWGILILSLPIAPQKPFGLLVLAGAMSGIMMWPYTVLIQIINVKRMSKHTIPGWPRVVAMWLVAAFFGYFTVVLASTTLTRDFGLSAFQTSYYVVDSALGGYLLWALLAVVQAYTMATTARSKFRMADAMDTGEASKQSS
ncbi:Nramp family divalent metal transporter [Haladaptatus sp. DFWS20]|uniref:Nramp family divalent metal transporter n=1 Tax=Haladaptatus sp. DFWS20 TaxID=3403467 RepID=UPI003EB9B16A